MRWIVSLLVGLGVAGLVVLALSDGNAPEPELDQGTATASGGSAGLAVSPVRSVVPADSSSTTIDYSLANPSRIARTYRVGAGELDDDGAPVDARTGDAGSWVTPEQRELVVAAGESVTTAVRVQAPSDRGVDERRIGVAFTDVTGDQGGGGAAVRTRIVTSVYVEGTGEVERDVSLADLDVPTFSDGPFDVRATLVNDGTVTAVPGSTLSPLVGTVGGAGGRFALAGDPVRASSSADVLGRVSEPPLACWCQVKVAVSDGDGGVSTVQGRVVVAPTWLLAAATFLVVLAVGWTVRVTFVARRRRGATT